MNESSRICVDVINEMPASFPLRVTYTYSEFQTSPAFSSIMKYSITTKGTKLHGESGIVEPTRVGGLTFPANSGAERLCITHSDDIITCEDEISGFIQLSGNTVVTVVDPHTASVTIQDNDCMSLIAT